MAIQFGYMGLLLAFQAAGSIIDYRNYKDNKKLIQMGRELEKSAIEANLEALKVQSGEESLQSMKDLRKNLGTQIATAAARGTRIDAGSAAFGIQKSIGSFNADERMRRLNLLSKEANLRAQNVLSGLHTLQSETQLGQAFTSKLFNMVPASAAFDAFGKTDLAKKWGFGMSPAGEA